METSNFQSVLLIATALSLAAATASDLARHRIPNSLVLATLGTGVICNLFSQGWPGIAHSALGILTGAATLFPLYFLKGTSAGDVKLMGALGSLLGPSHILLAGLFTLIYVVWRMAAQAGFNGHATLVQILNVRAVLPTFRKERFPYAAAISVGAITAIAYVGVDNL
jgi:Flp pilus assembly protein protease CpaA